MFALPQYLLSIKDGKCLKIPRKQFTIYPSIDEALLITLITYFKHIHKIFSWYSIGAVGLTKLTSQFTRNINKCFFSHQPCTKCGLDKTPVHRCVLCQSLMFFFLKWPLNDVAAYLVHGPLFGDFLSVAS